jgi:predicted metal-binding protein
MTEFIVPTTPQSAMPSQRTKAPCAVHVCTSCRPPGSAREPKENRPGFVLYQELCDAIRTSPLHGRVDVKPAECLSICRRPCGIALSLPGAWTYLFGDQQPEKATRDIVACVSLYIESPDGFMTRDKRPKSLRGSILGRVPPIHSGLPCT